MALRFLRIVWQEQQDEQFERAQRKQKKAAKKQKDVEMQAEAEEGDHALPLVRPSEQLEEPACFREYALQLEELEEALLSLEQQQQADKGRQGGKGSEGSEGQKGEHSGYGDLKALFELGDRNFEKAQLSRALEQLMVKKNIQVDINDLMKQ